MKGDTNTWAGLANAWEEPVNQMHFKFVTQLYNFTNAVLENSLPA
jgi:hypothetical protein